MSISFESIGMWCATFACENAEENTVVKAGTGGTADACGAGESFCGVVRSVGRDGKACSVQLGGLTEASYSGETPETGFCRLSADGAGGVKKDESGREHLIVDVDKGAKRLVMKL